MLDEMKVAGFKVRRNRNWGASVLAGAEFGLWWAPTTFAHAVLTPLLGAFDFLLLSIWKLIMWTAFTVMILGLGLSGFLVRTNDIAEDAAP